MHALPTPQTSRTILVKGSLIGTRDTADLLTDVQIVFTRRLSDGTMEMLTDSQGTGHYQVRLTAGVTYIGTMKWHNCDLETQLLPTPLEEPTFVMAKNFYMNYLDSTDYIGCLADWKKSRYQK